MKNTKKKDYRENKLKFWRILQIDEEIRTGKFPNTKDLAKKLEIGTRTIERDIEFMRDMYDAPIEYNSKQGGYFYTSETFFLKSLFLTEQELFAIAVFEKTLQQYRNTPIEGQLRAVFSKLSNLLPKDLVSINTFWLDDEVTYISEPAPSIDEKVFETVFSSVKRRHRLKFFYRSLEQAEPSLRICEPYHIICQRGAWYVLGYCLEKKEERIFSFSRMTKVKILEHESFEMPVDFKIENYIDKNIGVWLTKRKPFTVKLLFTSEVGVFAEEHIWNKDQKVRVNKDKSVEVSFKTTQFEEVKRFCLGQGATVKVLAPSELKTAVLDEAKRISELYHNDNNE